MKTIMNTLVAIALATGFAASAQAFDAKTFWEQQERNRGSL